MTTTCPHLFASYIKKKYLYPKDLSEKIAQLKEKGIKITTLNGSFDLLHAGHLEIIYQASLQADRLIVALNSDASIKKYKGPDRPLVPLEYRMQTIAALEMVDYVTYFDEADPRALLQIIKPDVHVNGPEYGEQCVEAPIIRENGGRIHIISAKIEGLSTSGLIDKVKQSACV